MVKRVKEISEYTLILFIRCFQHLFCWVKFKDYLEIIICRFSAATYNLHTRITSYNVCYTKLLRDTDITSMDSDKIVHLGIAHVPEGRNIFPKLSVEENLRMGCIMQRGLSKETVNQRLEEQYVLFPRLSYNFV